MPIVRQIPKLYLRGSLATITMSNVTEAERQQIGELVEYVANHREMVRHKSEIIKQFGVTIGGDYADDYTAAENEYQIAIWKGVISLLHHREYSYQCLSCKNSHYQTKRGKSKAIDQKLAVCPNCQKVKLSNKGSIDTQEEFINYDEYRALLALGHNGCEISSPIIPIEGTKKYDKSDIVFTDPKQLKKFFGEFAWNYFRQHLRENKRPEHKKTPQLISGRPAFVISEELISVCSQMNVDYNCAKEDDGYSFHILGMQTPPEFTIEFSRIKEKASKHGIGLQIENNTILIRITDVTSNQDEIEAVVVKPEHVTILDNQMSVNDDDNGSTLDQIDYRFVEGQKMILEDHVSAIEISDALSSIRRALPDGLCQAIYDILCQNGVTYEEFTDKFGSGDPKLNQIAEFFGLTVRAVNEFRDQIKLVCLSHGLSP